MHKKRTQELKPLFVERMKKLLDEKDFQKFLETIIIPPVNSIRCNTLKISPEELKAKLENYKWKINQPFPDYPEVIIIEGKINPEETDDKKVEVNIKSPISKRGDNSIACKGCELVDLEPGELGRALEHLLGYYYIQEIASMLPVLALNPKENEFVLDLCAAPGSKTTQLAAKINNTGTIIANEVSLGRLKILASNTERCGVTNAIITKKEGVALCKRMQNANLLFDKILLDAPCSGEGTLRSSSRTCEMWNPNTIKKMSHIQKNLFSAAFECLKQGGEIIYSTCTHAPEENEEIVDFALNKFKDAIKMEKVSLPVKCREGITEWQDRKYSSEVKKACRIYPQDNNTEGFFLAKFRRLK